MRIRAVLLAIGLIAAVGGHVHAQNQPIYQTGSVTRGHPWSVMSNGVAGDAGGPANGNLTGVGITNTGLPSCINDAPISSPSGYHQLCLGSQATVGTTGAPPGGGGGAVVGPATSGVGDLALFNNTSGTLLKDGGPPPNGVDVRLFMADPTGTTDSTAAFNACFAAVGSNCWAGGGRYFIAGIVQIPGGSTLDCGYAMGDLGSNTSAPGNLNVYPALLLTPGSGEITASGPSARVKGCLILNRNLTFPVANGSGFAGIALADNGNASFSVVDSEILGFDTGIWITGNRPYLQHLILDDTGINHANLEIDTGNTDSGVADDVKLQTGQSGTGCGNLRPGTGIRIGGSIPGATGVFLNDIVVQGFQTANYDFANSIKGGIIWSDDEGINCGYTGTGIIVEPNVTAEFDNVTVAQPNVGLQLLGNGAPFQVNQLYVEDHWVRWHSDGKFGAAWQQLDHRTVDRGDDRRLRGKYP